MLRERTKHTKSMSCLTLQKEVARNFPSLTLRKRSEPAFVPFNSERRLGRLISVSQSSPREKNNEELI